MIMQLGLMRKTFSDEISEEGLQRGQLWIDVR